MADIFGLEISNYQTLTKFRERGILEAQLRARCRNAMNAGVEKDQANRPHDFRFWDMSLSQVKRLEASGTYGFMTNNYQALTSMSDEVWYRSMRFKEFVPIITSGVKEGAESYAVTVKDMTGRGRMAGRQGGNAPTADTNLRKYSADLYLGEIDAVYTDEDMRNSVFAGMPLQSDKVEAAVTGAYNHLETVCFKGDPDLPETRGVFNQNTGATNPASRLTLDAAPLSTHVDSTRQNAAWQTLTNQEKVDVLNAAISKIIADTNEIVVKKLMNADLVIAMPPIIYDATCSQSFGDNADKSVKQYVDTSNPWKNRTGKNIMWKSLSELSTIAPVEDSRTNRIAIYVKHKDILEMRIVFTPRITRIMQEKRHTVLPYEYKYGTVQVKRGSCMIYIDGI